MKLIAKLETQATIIQPVLRQKLALDRDGASPLYLVRKGVFLASGGVGGSRNQALALAYPGDVLGASLLPPFAGLMLMSTTQAAVVWRFSQSALLALADDDPEIGRFLRERVSEQAQRAMLRGAICSRLSGVERVASLLVELALRIGVSAGHSVALELPLSRLDLASYLALNADTLSRILSRLRDKGLLKQSGRSRLVCRDMASLERETPMARTIVAMFGGGASARLFDTL